MSRAISWVRLIRTTTASPALSTQPLGPSGRGLGGARADDEAVFQEGYDGDAGGDKETGAPQLKPSWRYCNPHTFTHPQGSLSHWSQGIGWLARGPFQACPLMGTGIKPTEVGLPQSPLLLECFREWELSGSQVFWEVRKVRRSCNDLVDGNPDSKPLARALGSTLHFFELQIPHLESGLCSYLLVVRITWNNMLLKWWISF